MSRAPGQRSSLKTFHSASLINTVLESGHHLDLDPCDFDFGLSSPPPPPSPPAVKEYNSRSKRSMGRVSSSSKSACNRQKGTQHKR